MGTPDAGPPAARPRLVGLDLLRLAAVVLVLGRHTLPPPDAWPAAGRAVLGTWKRGGWVGVDLFFVLSGFLVSGLLFGEFAARGRLSAGRFYARRAWKIYPPFVVLIAATVAFHAVTGRPTPAAELGAELAFVQNYLPGLWNHTWSLAVEEHFYLLLPPLLLLIRRANRASPTPLRPVVWVAAAVAAAALAGRVANWRCHPAYANPTHAFPTHLRLDGLFCGVAVAYAYHFHRGRFDRAVAGRRRLLAAGGALLLAPPFAFDLETTPFLYTAGFTLFSAGAALLLAALLGPAPRGRAAARLAALGGYSYAIYLWHMPVALWLVPAAAAACGPAAGYGVRTAGYLAGSVAVGVVMAKLVELPALRLRDRWSPPRPTVRE